MNNTIKFSTNWNNKLNCNYFTTIRLMSKKYQVSKIFNIELKNQHHCKSIVVNMIYLKLNDLNDFNCYLDTGYSVDETKNIFKKMYPEINFEVTNLSIILLKKL